MRQTYKYRYIPMSGIPASHSQYLGDRMRCYRERAGLSRRALSEIVEEYSMKYGVRFTQSDICNYESGRCCPKIDKLTALCEATSMPSYWWTGKELKPATLVFKRKAA